MEQITHLAPARLTDLRPEDVEAQPPSQSASSSRTLLTSLLPGTEQEVEAPVSSQSASSSRTLILPPTAYEQHVKGKSSTLSASSAERLTSSPAAPKSDPEQPTPGCCRCCRSCWDSYKLLPRFLSVGIPLGFFLLIPLLTFLVIGVPWLVSEAKEKQALEARNVMIPDATSTEAPDSTSVFTPSAPLITDTSLNVTVPILPGAPPSSTTSETLDRRQQPSPWRTVTSPSKSISKQPISDPPMHTSTPSAAPSKARGLPFNSTFQILTIEPRASSTPLVSGSANTPISGLPTPQVSPAWPIRPSFSMAIRSPPAPNNTASRQN